MQTIAKTLIIFGVILIVIGALYFRGQSRSSIQLLGPRVTVRGAPLNFAHKIPFIGRLPGDVYIQKKNFSFYFPLTTSLLISIILSVIFWLWSHW